MSKYMIEGTWTQSFNILLWVVIALVCIGIVVWIKSVIEESAAQGVLVILLLLAFGGMGYWMYNYKDDGRTKQERMSLGHKKPPPETMSWKELKK